MKDFDLTNEEKAKGVADFLYYKLSHIDYNTLKRELLEMAQWKDEKWESDLREFLYRTFYVHPHNYNHICTDDFECKGDFDQFVDDFINRLKDPEQWQE